MACGLVDVCDCLGIRWCSRCCVLWTSGGIEIGCDGADFSFVVCGEPPVNQHVLWIFVWCMREMVGKGRVVIRCCHFV